MFVCCQIPDNLETLLGLGKMQYVLLIFPNRKNEFFFSMGIVCVCHVSIVLSTLPFLSRSNSQFYLLLLEEPFLVCQS